MSPGVEIWTVAGFLDSFMETHERIQNRSFSFILGAGASQSSAIPTGSELVIRWLGELQRRLDPLHQSRPLKDWVTAETLGIDGFTFDRSVEFYPKVYERRFRADAEAGFAQLESLMAAKDPSIGYSILAQVLMMRHRVVITTNFDNLIADALSIYTQTYPLVCGHESLVGFVHAQMRRPLIAKIHRDLLLAPRNDTLGTSMLEAGWVDALRILFKEYSPIFIGYGGNDGSLMGFLRELDSHSIAGRPVWCFREEDGIPRREIQETVNQLNGVFVPIVGFDELMMQLGERLKLPLLAGEIERRAKERADRYRAQIEKLSRSVRSSVSDPKLANAKADVAKALDSTIDRQSDWWAWQLRASREGDAKRREKIYEEALRQIPNSSELCSHFAVFLDKIGQDARAEQLHQKALNLNANSPVSVSNYATFLWKRRKNYDEAELLYRKAMELDPTGETHAGNLATFRWLIRSDYEDAERLYRRALSLTPNDVTVIANLANFLGKVRKSYAEAERLYRKALELEPLNHTAASNFGAMLLTIGRIEEATELAKRSWALTGDVDQSAAKTCWCIGLIWRIKNKADNEALGRLKDILHRGFDRVPAPFKEVLSIAKPRISKDDADLYDVLADVIVGELNPNRLDTFARWQEVEPISFELDWQL